MAYNILKGDVEFSGGTPGTIEDMVDNHNDQTISGVKTFVQTVTASAGLSASFFYGDGSNLQNVSVSSAITAYADHQPNRVIIGGSSPTEISGAVSMTYDGTTLALTGNVSASANISGSGFYGDGHELTNIGPTSLRLGSGLRDLADNLEINLSSSGGLRVDSNGLGIYLPNISVARTNLISSDEFLVDVSGSGTNAITTMGSIYNYVTSLLSIPSSAGTAGRVQLSDGAGDFVSDSTFSFNSTTDVLSVPYVSATNVTASGHVSASVFFGDGSNLSGVGGSSTSINVFTASFNVLNTYDVVGISTSGSVVTASLPGASSLSSGQRLVFKDVGGSGSVNDLVIEASGSETIDGASTLKISTDWGATTIVSDGVGQYFIIGTN
jgi:hypothetical protein